jgi:pyruvate/2-oxoglutarate dehydrogenase complex dihydrolipoamide acyltransferase (E2) component
MRTRVMLPQWGMSMLDGTVVQWLKAEGESVAAGEPLVEIEAEKVTEVVHAPVSGVLAKVVALEGQTVGVQEVLAEIESE